MKDKGSCMTSLASLHEMICLRFFDYLDHLFTDCF